MNIYKKSSKVENFKKFVFKNSRNEEYTQLMKESHDQRVCRIYHDKSFIYQEELSNVFINKFKWVQILLMGHKRQFEPTSNKILIWYSVVFLVILFFFFEATLIITYGEIVWQQLLASSFLIFLEVFWILVLVFDIYVQLNTAFLYKGMIIREKARIMRRYLIYFSVTDLLTILVYLIALGKGDYTINYFKMIIVLKFARIIQIDRLYLRRLSIHRKIKTFYVILKQMIVIMIISHIMALGFYTIDYSLLQTDQCTGNNTGLCWLNATTSWTGIIDLSWQFRYFYSLYWGVNIVTTIDYGDIQSGNPQEATYELPMMIIGFFVYGYITNNIIQVLLWARGPSDHLKNQLRIIQTYMSTLKIKQSLRSEVKSYLQFLYIEEKNRNVELQEEIKAKLPDDLRFELVSSAYNKLNNSFKTIFEGSNDATSLLYYIEEKKHTAGDLIMVQGMFIDKICYLHKGEVFLECEYSGYPHFICSHSTYDEFFLLYQYLLNQKSKFSLKSIKQSVFYFISRENIEKCILKSFQLREIFKIVVNQIFVLKKLKHIYYQCYLCGENHHWYHCGQHFATFTEVKLKQQMVKKEEKHRKVPQKHIILIDRSKLRDIKKLSSIRENQLFDRIQNRLFEIKSKIVESKNSFEVDSVHEWGIFYPTMNIGKIKEEFNNKKKGEIKENKIIAQLSHMIKLF